MITNTNPIAVKYSDSKLRILVEEYITMQKHELLYRIFVHMFSIRPKKNERQPTKDIMRVTDSHHPIAPA